jgi:transcription antitermination protein NusB
MTAAGTTRRRGARKIALDVLYEHDVTGAPIAEIAEILGRYDPEPAHEFAGVLVRGVVEHRAELDNLIASYAEDWTIERMPVIDRNLLRLGTFELLYLDDVPAAVTINEAVELAKTYSTEDSGRFVNGILGRIAGCTPSRN